jgi:predicted secreted protein
MSEIVVTRSGQGGTIDARLGDVIVLRLEENLTTGYGWEIVSGEGTILALKGSTYSEAAGIAMGRGGIRLVLRRAGAGKPGSPLAIASTMGSAGQGDRAIQHHDLGSLIATCTPNDVTH